VLERLDVAISVLAFIVWARLVIVNLGCKQRLESMLSVLQSECQSATVPLAGRLFIIVLDLLCLVLRFLFANLFEFNVFRYTFLLMQGCPVRALGDA